MRSLALLALCVPLLGHLSGVHDEAAVLRDVRVRLQPAARLRPHAVLRPRRVLRRRRLRHRVAGHRARLGAGRGDPGRCGGRGLAGRRHRRPRHPPPGHLFRDDHAGARAAGVLRVPRGALHRRGERPAGRAARRRCSGCCRCSPTWSCTTWCWRSLWRCSCSSGAWCTRRSARCSRRSARTSRARSRSATRSIATNCWPSCCRRPSPGSPAR